uniref:Secreted protein n=1 Tax=Syphacia muris TaxID=451379 RepID=A0A0N5AFV2_9BILA
MNMLTATNVEILIALTLIYCEQFGVFGKPTDNVKNVTKTTEKAAIAPNFISNDKEKRWWKPYGWNGFGMWCPWWNFRAWANAPGPVAYPVNGQWP